MALAQTKQRIIYDPIYGFIKLTPIEWEIIHSPFYQRLRWIKQLGFSFYVFPGAEHSRFGHSIGVMNNAHKILERIECAVSEKELMDIKVTTDEALLHRSIRLAALLHDLGTFCFSHTTEGAYISFGETTNQKNGRGLLDDHENLGSFIIKNTDYPGGITRILKKYDLDPQVISDLVKGVGPNLLANQILHSEIDCDRMDYLLRDAHYTGLNYGTYDRDYLLHHFKVKNINGTQVLTIRHNAIHCVEDFLMSRFAWYSQVIRSPRGAKYDAVAEHLCFHLLKTGDIYRYSDLLEMVEKDPHRFFSFNDNYFISKIHELFSSGKLDRDLKIKDMAHTLLFESGAKSARAKELRQVLIEQDDKQAIDKISKKAQARVSEIEKALEKHGGKADWIIADIPKKPIVFVKSFQGIVKENHNENVLLTRDPVKISFDDGDVRLLAEVDNSIISKVHKHINYIPNVFCSGGAFDILCKLGIIEDEV